MTTVAAKTWQAYYWPAGSGDTKKLAWKTFRGIWPNESMIFPRCKKQHDGCVDAALIALWAAAEF